MFLGASTAPIVLSERDSQAERHGNSGRNWFCLLGVEDTDPGIESNFGLGYISSIIESLVSEAIKCQIHLEDSTNRAAHKATESGTE